jgi:PAS domain S-box-containing protein
MAAIHSGSTDSLIFPIYDRYAASKDFVLTVDPLPRPAGFSAVRGRQYMGHRAGSKLLPDMLRSTSVEKLNHLLNASTAGLFTTNAFGLMEYVNPAFESLLGYEPGHIVEKKLSLHHVLFSLGDKTITEQYTVADYTGPATLVKHDGTRINATLSQQLMRDAQGRAAGVTGIFHLSGG